MPYQSEAYMHDLDKQARRALARFPGFSRLEKEYDKRFDEEAARLDLLSTAVRLGNDQMPEIYGLLPPICEKLAIPVPELYYVASDDPNAATFGTRRPCVVVTSALIKTLDPSLLSAVIAHECGHIACGHSKLRAIANGIDGGNRGKWGWLPGRKDGLKKQLTDAILVWDRCSELSADRAAALCDGGYEKLSRALLMMNGYGGVSLDAFVAQASEFAEAVESEGAEGKLVELVTRGETHPRLATRIHECRAWTLSNTFKALMDGTLRHGPKEATELVSSREVVEASLELEDDSQPTLEEVEAALERTAAELDRYTAHLYDMDYCFAVFSGVMAAAIDSVFVGEVDLDWERGAANRQVNSFIERFARSAGWNGEGRLKGAISYLEKKFPVPQDNTWNGAHIKVSSKDHHLADLAHHPTPLGLAASIVSQVLRVGVFVNRDGEIHIMPLATSRDEAIAAIVPILATAFLRWLVNVAQDAAGVDEKDLPEALRRIVPLIASTPLMFEIADCAERWLGHLVSDMGGSKKTAGAGMGIPGVMLSLLHELSGLPGLSNTGLPQFLETLYKDKKFDLRHELALVRVAGKQTIPVIFNECYVRLLYFVGTLAEELAAQRATGKSVDWARVMPFGNRTVDRMVTVASMTFTVANTADAAIHAAVESAGNWVVFSGRFVSRFNYVGAGRAALSVVKEVSDERRQCQLIYETMLLAEASAVMRLDKLAAFEKELEANLANYLAEDISAFVEGVERMDEGLESGDANAVIAGNLTIQRVLGREPQFTNQDEFDDLMGSDDAFVL